MYYFGGTYGTYVDRPEPGCPKLTASLVNVLLKFQMLISEICQIIFYLLFFFFFLKKCEKLVPNTNFRVFDCKVVKHLTS